MNKTYIATMGERFFMSKIAIATDSNSGITQAQGRELGIFVMPMPFYINDELFLEDITLSQEQFYQRLEEGADVKTTQPAPGDVLELWDRILKDYDELVYIPMSSGLSSSCETALLLACQLLFVLLTANVGLVEDLRHCNLDWINETQAAKQGAGVLLSMLLGFGFVVAVGALYFFLLAELMPTTAFLGLILALMAILYALTARWLMTRGVKRFETLR